MIFNCPACSAGHSVPVSMIPNGGMDISCRRCDASFNVDVDDPEPTDLDESGKPPEATTIGVANPYDELVGDAQLIAPSGEVLDKTHHDADEDTEALPYGPGVSNFDKPTRPIATGRSVPLGPDEVGVDPELDNTQRVEVDEEVPTFEPQVSNVPTPPPRVIGPSKSPPPNGRPRIDSNNDVYAQVASGTYEPKPPRSTSATPKEKAWNEPSSIVQIGAGPGAGLRRFAEALNRAPLALKVALIVFPVSLGITLVVTAFTQGGDPPVEISPTAVNSVDSTETTEAETPQPPDPKPSPRAQPAPAEEPVIREPAALDDTPAPDGHAYVQAGNVRMRARASDRGNVVARLPVGQLVRRYRQQGDFALVIVEPDGPVGFVADRLLGSKKPVAALADNLAFEGCVPTDGVDACLFSAKQSEGACVDRCDTDRCREACGVAFDRCTRGCNQVKTRRRRSKRRR